ncbi:alpha/beta fold hydrolase [Streptosporangium sp. DT93]|uniref:alpha/beta fold hydrolase n=1 Tax=Streptosporangium sp. DT93 TaxID=3393428 RepID=UPI003CFB432B
MTDLYTGAGGAHAVQRGYRELLDAWPVPAERLRVPTGQGETFVLACGPPQAPPVLLLHGSGTNSAMWAGEVADWARHFRLYAVDMIGEPGLSAPSRPSLASGAYADWLDDVLAGLGVRDPHLVGVSLGGWLALEHATRRPGRTGALALLCPGGIGRQRYAVLVAALLLMPFGRWGRRTTMGLVLGPGAAPGPAPTPEEAARERAFGEHAMLIHEHFRPRREKLPVFTDEALRGLRRPLMVTVGGRDALLDSHDTARRLRETVPHATVRLLPEAGHLIRDQRRPILEFLLSARQDGTATDPEAASR